MSDSRILHNPVIEALFNSSPYLSVYKAGTLGSYVWHLNQSTAANAVQSNCPFLHAGKATIEQVVSFCPERDAITLNSLPVSIATLEAEVNHE